MSLSQEIAAICVRMGVRLKAARKKKFPKDDQRTFARRIGVSRETLRKMESGDPRVSLFSYLEASDLLDCLEGFNELFKLPRDLFEEFERQSKLSKDEIEEEEKVRRLMNLFL